MYVVNVCASNTTAKFQNAHPMTIYDGELELFFNYITAVLVYFRVTLFITFVFDLVIITSLILSMA